MSINQSFLSAPQYGYDFVVASTMQAINANLFQFLAENDFPLITQYYWTDSNNQTTVVSLNTLETTPVSPDNTNPSGTKGVDPATVAGWNGQGPKPTGYDDLNNSSFQCGFIAKIGIPPGFCLPGVPNPDSLPVLPLMVTFDQSSMSVIFNLYCSTFQVFDASWGRGGMISYNNQSQPSGSTWFLQTTIPIDTILTNSNLPLAVKAQLKILAPNAFSVQKLFFDLDQPAKSTATSVNFGGITPGSALQTILADVFGGLYCSGLAGMPALGYNILPNSGVSDPSSLGLGSMKMEVNPYIVPAGQGNLPELSTLNYLCAQGPTVPPANLFNWNWIDTSASGNQYDGVIAINRNALAQYLAAQMASFVAANCLQPQVRVSTSYPSVNYYFPIVAGTPPTPTFPQTGGTVLNFRYNSADSSDSAGSKWLLDYGSLDMHSSYTLNVIFQGNTITVVQNLVVYADMCWEDSCESGNFVNKIMTDVYTINVSESGNLVLSTPVSNLVDNSDVPSAGWLEELFTGINDIVDAVAEYVDFKATSFGSLPVALINNFVFPGGNTFAYANVNFSDNQDLVSYITYLDPGYRKMRKASVEKVKEIMEMAG